jgi:hypothetical protein
MDALLCNTEDGSTAAQTLNPSLSGSPPGLAGWRRSAQDPPWANRKNCQNRLTHLTSSFKEILMKSAAIVPSCFPAGAGPAATSLATPEHVACETSAADRTLPGCERTRFVEASLISTEKQP